MSQESSDMQLIDVDLSNDPIQKVKAVIAMLHSSSACQRVLECAGLDGEPLSEETEKQIHALVDEANAKKDAEQPADRRAWLPNPPHGSIPEECKKAVEALGVNARSVYRDIFLYLRMATAFDDVRRPRAGIFSYHLFPVEMLESALKQREAAKIQDGVTRRLQALIPQLKAIEKEMEQQKQGDSGRR